MVHIQDLAQFAFKITERPPKTKYIFAIDHSKETKHKRIFEAIFKGVSGDNFINIPDREELQLDLRMLPSKAFDVEE
jgi:hypothetical protein